MISSSCLAELQHVPPAWKFCAVQSQERFDRENAQRADRHKWKTTARPQKHCPPARIEATKKSKRRRSRAGTTRKDREEVEVLRGSLHGVARVLQAAQLHLQLQEAVLLPAAPTGATSCGQHVGLRARVVVLEGHERAHQSELGFEQQSRFRNSWEIQSSERALTQRKARAREEPSPLQRRTQDHWATSPAAGPRRAHGSAAAKRARPRRRANLACGKICDFCPELGFEQRNRFRSLRDTRRAEKKVLRKPPAARPVVGQTFKYIY